LKDTKDDLKSASVHFNTSASLEPKVLELIRIHESWLSYSEELLRWGEFNKCKDLVKECALHARILKDQDSYCRALLLLQTLAYLEGDSAGALRLAMIC
jgi:hypothetical protein